MTVTAKFEVYSYVYFMNEDGTKVVYYTAAGVAGENVAEADLNAATAKVELTMGKEKGVVGWSTTQDSNTPDASITFVAGDTYVYPVVKTGFWVTFNTDGGDYVAPKFQMGAPLDLSAVTPTCSGYTFDGWYIDGQKVTSVSAEATVTAHWKANSKTEYTVIHWQENANDDGYSLKETETQNGKTGSETKAAAKEYDGFTAPQTIEQKTIAGDGSTIVNIYYKRNVYTVNFYDRKGKKEYTDLRISAKYGANISKKWPTYNGSNTWYIGKNSNTSQVNIDTMPLNGAKFYGPMTGYGSETAYYYVEVLPGEKGTTTVGGITYKEDHRDTSPGKGYNVTKEDQYPITGFTFNANVSTPIHGKYNKAKFYYTRDSYDITFINGGKTEKTESRKYQQNISDVTYTPPTRPTGVPANFTFAGWYENELCKGDPFVFTGKTMPAKGITLYAKWQAPQVNATVYLSASADGESVTIEIPYGTKLSDSEEFKKLLDEEFTEEKPSAWIDSNGALFNVDTELYGSVTISPFFPSAKDGFTVTYVEGTNVKTDNQKYVSGSSARVLSPENSENFRAWKMEDGKLIHPGDKITVTKNTTLTAVYTNKPQTETITYHYNFTDKDGNYNADTFEDGNHPKNTKAEVLTLSAAGFELVAGYEFLGWALTANGSITYRPGDEAFVDGNGDNDLWAVWSRKSYKVTWLDEDGSLLREDTVEYGEMPEYGENPTKAATDEYTYTFDKWTPELEAVTKDATYQASYKAEKNSYKVTWLDEDGSLLREDTVKYGEMPEYGENPTKAATDEYTYTFDKWTPELEAVTKDATYQATYTKEANTYTLTYDLDGGEWTEATNEFPYEYKATVEVVKTVPTREGYKFSGWRSEEVTIENDAFTMPAKDVVLKAVWEANPTPTPIPSEEPTPTPAPTEEPTPTPAPNPNPNPATSTPTPVAPVVPATVATPTPKPTATPSTTPSDNGGKGDGNNDGEIGETINDNETPLANGEDIADNATPLAGLGTGAWALINLILTIVTTLLSILLLIGYIGKKKKALEDEDGNVVLDENGKEVMEYEKNKKGLWRLISIIPALIAIIVFIFTEDMTLPMIFVDKWTILHVVIALVQVVVMVLCKKKKDENDEDENAANA